MNIEIVKPDWYPLTHFEGIEQHIERCGRVCYRSEDKITDDSAEKFIKNICRRNHESVLEHASITVIIICSRACSHQLVRHRIAAYSQESQRYCNYGKNGLKVICPPRIGLAPGVYACDGNDSYKLRINVDDPWGYVTKVSHKDWLRIVFTCYKEYLEELESGVNPEDARYVLPNATKTELAVTFNCRMWRHVFTERALNKAAQWEIRGIFDSILKDFAADMPSIFGDLIHA